MPVTRCFASAWTTRALCLLLLLSCSGGSEPSAPRFALLSIGPSATLPTGGTVFLTAHGTGFQNGAVIERDSRALQTTFTSDTRLVAAISLQGIAVPDTLTIRVRNPDGELSNGVPFIVSPDAQPFGIDSTAPASATEANAGTSITVYFSEALDSASIVDTSIVVHDETGAEVSGTISSDAGGRTLHWQGLLPGAHQYTASVSDELRTPSGGGLGGPATWSFLTTLGVTVPLEPDAVWPNLVLGSNGLPRVLYRTSSEIRVGGCTGSCDTRALWSLTDVSPVTGSDDYLSLAIDGADNLHLGLVGLCCGPTYATPAGQMVTIDDGSAAYTSIGTNAAGTLHLLYYNNTDLHGAACSADCGTATNWQVTAVDTSGNAGSFTSVVVEPQGGVHVTYFENDSGDLRYAVCASPCTTPTWSSGPVDTTGRVGIGSSLVLDGTGTLHASWVDVTAGDVVYGTCAAACTTVNGWSRTVVEHIAEPGFDVKLYLTSLALGPNGLELSYYDILRGQLHGASCASGCTTPGAWTTFAVSLNSIASGLRMTSLKVDNAGQRHVLWIDRDGVARYTRY